jgi:hypothetical protein
MFKNLVNAAFNKKNNSSNDHQKVGLMKPLNTYFKPVPREVHVVKEHLNLVDAATEGAEESKIRDVKLHSIEERSDERKKRAIDAILNIAEMVSPVDAVDDIRRWIDTLFDPEMDCIDINKFHADNESDGLGGTVKTRRPLNWQTIAHYHYQYRDFQRTVQAFPVLAINSLSSIICI